MGRSRVMHVKHLSALMIVVGSLASCAPMQNKPLDYPIMMPVRAEPSFELAGRPTFDADPENELAQRDDALLSQLFNKPPKLMTNRALVMRKREDLIVSGGKPYRRVWLTHEDGR